MGLFNKNQPEADFWEYLEKEDYTSLTNVFNQGKKFDVKDMEGCIKQASWSENFSMMYFLWRNGAPSPTPFIAEIFDRFKKGETFEVMIKEKQAKKNAELAMVKVDLSDFKSAQQIPVDEIAFYKDAEDEDEVNYILSIRFGYYLQDGHVHKHNTLVYTIHYNQLIKDGTLITKDHFWGDESIYLFSSHNRVNLISLRFSKISNTQLNMTIELDFKFSMEGNGDDETRMLEKIIHLPL